MDPREHRNTSPMACLTTGLNAPSKTTIFPAIPVLRQELHTFGEPWQRREIGPCGRASVRSIPFSFLGSEDNTVVRISLYAISRHERSIEQVGSLPVLPFCLAFSVPLATCSPALRTHALLPGIRFRASARCGLLPQSKCGSPSTDSVHSPREELGDGTPSGQACTADSGQNQKKRSPTPCSTKLILAF